MIDEIRLKEIIGGWMNKYMEQNGQEYMFTGATLKAGLRSLSDRQSVRCRTRANLRTKWLSSI